MTFTSLLYFIFLPITYCFFYFLKARFRWLVLLIASYIFYSTFKAPQLIFALLFVTAASYFVGIQMGQTSSAGRRKLFFWFGVTTCVLLLVAIKLIPVAMTLLGVEVQPAYSNLLLS